MNIALYQGQNYHTEIAGTFIESLSDHNISIYYDTNDKLHWIDYYQQIFPDVNISTYYYSQIINDLNHIDVIIFLTGMDSVLPWTKNYTGKIISVPHIKSQYKSDPAVILTPLLKDISNNYVLPIYNKTTKITVDYEQTILAIVGLDNYSLTNKHIQDLDLLLSTANSNDFTIYIFSRYSVYLKNINNKYNNVKVFANITTIDMIHKLDECKFIIPLVKPGSWYYQDRLSGSIPLAINNNKPMLLPKKFNNIYEMNFNITYNHSLTEIIDKILNISNQEYLYLLAKLVIWKRNKSNSNNKIIHRLVYNDNFDYMNNHNYEYIKGIVSVYPATKNGYIKRLLALQNCYKGKKAVIFTCGPSLKYSQKYLKHIFNNPAYITISIKQSYDYLIDKGFVPDFHLVNFCNEKVYNYNDYKSISIYSQKRQISIASNTKNLNNYDIIVSHQDNNEEINIHTGIINNIDRMSFRTVFKNGNNLHYWGDIMHELAIPLCIEMGISHIYVVGWDCGDLTQYFDNSTRTHNRPTIRSVLDQQIITSSNYLFDFMLNLFNIEIYNLKERGKESLSALSIPTIDYQDLIE